MKVPNHIIKIDQAYLRYKEAQQHKRERRSILRFALGLLIMGALISYYVPILMVKAL